jgi:hypothetical protein
MHISHPENLARSQKTVQVNEIGEQKEGEKVSEKIS